MDIGVYTVAEIARILKISEKTAYKLIQDQELPHVRVRGQIRITAMALDFYLQGGECGGKTTESDSLHQE